MIEQHAANTAWLGLPAGVVTGDGKFLHNKRRRGEIACWRVYAFVEFEHPLLSPPPPAAVLLKRGACLGQSDANRIPHRPLAHRRDAQLAGFDRSIRR